MRLYSKDRFPIIGFTINVYEAILGYFWDEVILGGELIYG